MASKKDISPDILGSLPKGFFDARPERGKIRLLKIGEEIRKILAEFLARGEIDLTASSSFHITVEEVTVSPDLRHATVYITLFALNQEDLNSKEILKELQEATPHLRYLLGRAIRLKFIPDLLFKLRSS